MIKVTRLAKKCYQVYPTKASLFLMKYKMYEVLTNSDEYAETPSIIRNACDFKNNEFKVVSEEFAYFFNDLVFVKPSYKISYKIEVSKDLMILLNSYRNTMIPILANILDKTPLGKVEHVMETILSGARDLQETEEDCYTFFINSGEENQNEENY